MDYAKAKQLFEALERERVKDTVRLKDRADAALLRERFGIEDE